MTKNELVEVIKQRARKNFSKGFNCAECVVEAVINSVETGLPREIQKLATGFGGGGGLYGDTCGAISGAILSVGAVHGRSRLPEGEIKNSTQELYGKPGLYRLFNLIPNRIKDKFGNTLCREIAKPWKENWLCRDHALHCREIITEAAGIAAELVLSDKNELASKPFGANVENLVEAPEKGIN